MKKFTARFIRATKKRAHASLLAVLVVFSPVLANAQTSLTGLWWNPSESGWGVTLDHQASFVFATFYIYDGDAKPFWIVSELSATTASQDAFSGPVYSVNGTPFSRVPFSPTDVRVTALGTATLVVLDGSHASISYTVNGIRVEKQIQRQTTKGISLTGTFTGNSSTSYAIVTSGSSLTISTGNCQFVGAPLQAGTRFSISGSYRCADLNDGTWYSNDMALHDGVYLMATVCRQPIGTTQCLVENWYGSKSGGNTLLDIYTTDRMAQVSMSGLWWNPNESGWGVTFDQQGAFIFATFFIYDAGGKPFWIVGELSATPTSPSSFSGPVYNATGTPFSRVPFVSADTRVAALGTASFSIIDANHATISYTVNGTRVEKQVQRQTTKPLNILGRFTGGVTPAIFGVVSNNYDVTQVGSTLTIMKNSTFAAICKYTGIPNQLGARIAITGAYRCGLTDGTWSTDDWSLIDGTKFAATITQRANGSSQSSTERWFGLKLP